MSLLLLYAVFSLNIKLESIYLENNNFYIYFWHGFCSITKRLKRY